MNNETNRLAQIIANAADKELGTRVDPTPKRQDKAAALAIEAEYLFIRRDELPATSITDRNGDPQLEVAGAEIGTWPLKHPKNTAEQQRKYALEYFAAHIAIQQWHDDVLTRRRDELAVEHFEGVYEHLPREGYRKAIDRIIELEGKAA